MKIRFKLNLPEMIRQRQNVEQSHATIDVNVSQLSDEYAAILAESICGAPDEDEVPASALILTGTDVVAVCRACEERYLEKARIAARDAELPCAVDTRTPKDIVIGAVEAKPNLLPTQLVVELREQLAPEQTYDGIRRATRDGELRFDSKMTLVRRRP